MVSVATLAEEALEASVAPEVVLLLTAL